jgi:imidazolonepropionase-like amidohydrolase
MAAGADSIEHCTFFTADGVDADPDLLEELARGNATISMTAAFLPGSEAPYPAMRQRLDAIRANFGILFRSGARIVCSSDTGVGPNKPHDVLPYGVAAFLPSIGMSNAEALTATTAVAAELCGVADTAGTLEPGKDADIIAVSGNPLADLSAIHDVVAVFAKGRATVET